MTAPIIARVTESRNGQRRITIPKDIAGIQKGDWVEIRRLEFARQSPFPANQPEPAPETPEDHS